MDDPSARKAEARRAAEARRKAAREADPGAGEAARAALLALLGGRPASRIVSGYLPIRTEIDPVPAMAELSARGHLVCVPVIEGRGRPLLFREWTPGCALSAGPFGAQVPMEGAWLSPDTLIVPLLAFSGARFRLGYGGGFYDRTLAALRAGGPVFAVGLAHAAQRDDAIPVEPTDERLDAIVTEAGILD